MDLQIRPITADEIAAFERAVTIPFGFDPTAETSERFRNVFELARLRAACDGDQIVATFGALTAQISVPGNLLPLAATSIVTVLPTHRRRGLLRKLMTEHLAELKQNGEPLAALWASESSIYARFGYGPACEKAVVKLDKSFARLREPPVIAGTMRLLERPDAQRIFPSVYDRAMRERPGMLARSPNSWEKRVLSDPEYMRGGGTAHRLALYARDSEPAGYVIYRTRANWERHTNEVRVVELVGLDPSAEKALWQYLFDIDLTTSIDAWNRPPDDPLRWWLHESRKLETKIEDGLWLRVVDVEAALSGRRYACPASLVLRVIDSICPWNDGVWELSADKDGMGRCQPATAAPELELTADALGMLYLGGHRVKTLARAGLVRALPEALERADSLFAWDPLPWCPEFF